MKILIYHSVSLRYSGGAETSLLVLSRALTNLGIHVTIVTTNFDGRPSGYSPLHWSDISNYLSGARLLEVPYLYLPPGTVVPAPSGIKRLFEEFKEHDVLHFINYFGLNDIIIYTIQRHINKPVVSSLQTPLFHDKIYYNLYVKSIGLLLLNKFNANCVLNNKELSNLIARGVKNVHVVPNAVDTNLFKPEPKRRKDDVFRILLVSRLDKRKGLELLWDILNGLRKYLSNYEFVIAGAGPMIDVIEKLKSNFNEVRYLGSVPYTRMPNVYNMCDVALSLSMWGTFSMVAAEAHACGLPVIGWDNEPNSEIVINGLTGRLVPLGDVVGIVKSLLYYYNIWKDCPSCFTILSKKAREISEINFSGPAVAKRLIDVYRTVLNYT
ncbi:MAG: glycosyltransferase family 4 protein [Thermoproteota archaeon]